MQMAHNFRRRLLSGELLVGTMVTLGAPETAEILALAGFDWLFLDAEHSPMSPKTAQRVMMAAGRETPCLVRLESSSETAVKKALDSGAAGIIAPMVNSAAQAEELVRWAKYAPGGSRGVGLGRAAGYGAGFVDYLARANEETAVVVQVEHIEGVEHIEAIAQVEGVDAVLVGPYDLSASMGRMGEVTHAEVQQAIGRVTAVCKQYGVALGAFGVSASAVLPYIERGYTLIVAGVDTLMLSAGARRILEALK
jgi:2-keto-3-deoxy-L-rhamnonate aldolase RhmA